MDDPPPLREKRHRHAGQMHRAINHCVEGFAPGLQGRAHRLAADVDPRTIDQDINPRPLGAKRRLHRRHSLRIAVVPGANEVPPLRKPLLHPLQHPGPPRQECDIPPLPGEPLGGRRPDSRGGAGHQDCLAFGHVGIPYTRNVEDHGMNHQDTKTPTTPCNRSASLYHGPTPGPRKDP